MKKNNSDQYESITVTLSKEKTPIAFEKRVESLMSSGLSREDADIAAGEELAIELYYDINNGLFGVEPEAVESADIYNPYTAELLDESDEY